MSGITLQFSASATLMGDAIRWFTQGQVNHVDAVLPDGRLLGAQQDGGLGGQPSGVWIRPAAYLDGARKWRVTLPATDDQAAAWLAFLADQVGKPYDLTCIAGFVAGRDWRRLDAWICSELQAAAAETTAIVRQLCAPANKITPQEYFLVCSALAPVEALPV